jgi:glycosyltransferase involved in cell wall biosynthesis
MISVLIANYNNSKFLIEAIESVYTQTLDIDEIEVIICDDCSTDDSVEILEELQSKYEFDLLKNDKNLGVGATKARLTEASKGDWFIFLDSDDKFKTDCLNMLWHHIYKLNNENLSMLYANSIRCDENGTLTEWSRSKSFQGSLLVSKFEYPIFHPIIYNRKKYNLTKGIDVHLKSADDFDLWYKMEEVGQIDFVNEPLYYYRINQNGVSQVGGDTQKWVQVMLEHAYCTGNAAKRRGLDVRVQFNDFAEVIHKRLTNKKNKFTIYRRCKMKIRSFFSIV